MLKEDIIKRIKHGDPCRYTQCAAGSNNLLRRSGSKISGNAWGLNNAKLIYSGYENIERPQEYDSAKVSNYNKKASQEFYDHFDSTKLDTTKNYAVNMRYEGSPYQKKAFNEGRDVSGTHTGVLRWKNTTPNRKGYWENVHNIGGTWHVDNFIQSQGPRGRYGVTAIYEPKKRTFVDSLIGRLRSAFNLKHGGKIEYSYEGVLQILNKYEK